MRACERWLCLLGDTEVHEPWGTGAGDIMCVREGHFVAGGPSRGLLASRCWLQRNLCEQHTLGREAWTEWRVRGNLPGLESWSIGSPGSKAAGAGLDEARRCSPRGRVRLAEVSLAEVR